MGANGAKLDPSRCEVVFVGLAVHAEGGDQIDVQVGQGVQQRADDSRIGEVGAEGDEYPRAGRGRRGGAGSGCLGSLVRLGPEREVLGGRLHAVELQAGRAGVEQPATGGHGDGGGQVPVTVARRDEGAHRLQEGRRHSGAKGQRGDRGAERRGGKRSDEVEQLTHDQVGGPGVGRGYRLGCGEVDAGAGEELRDTLRGGIGRRVGASTPRHLGEQHIGQGACGERLEAFGLDQRRQAGRGEDSDGVALPLERAGQREQREKVPEGWRAGEKDLHADQNSIYSIEYDSDEKKSV